MRPKIWHQKKLNTGHILIAGWSEYSSEYFAMFYSPLGGEKAIPKNFTKGNEIRGPTPKSVISRARREILEEVNPDLKKVRERLTDGDTLSYKKLRQMQKAFAIGTNYGMSSKLIMTSTRAKQLEKDLGGLSPDGIIIDEMADTPILADMTDALKYALQTTDKKKRRSEP